MAVRTALGATRLRLLRLLLTENLILALAGGVLGVLVAAWGLEALAAFAARFTTRASEIRLDGRVLLFACGLSLFTGVLRSEEHTSELQSQSNLVCRLLL